MLQPNNYGTSLFASFKFRSLNKILIQCINSSFPHAKADLSLSVVHISCHTVRASDQNLHQR